MLIYQYTVFFKFRWLLRLCSINEKYWTAFSPCKFHPLRIAITIIKSHCWWYQSHWFICWWSVYWIPIHVPQTSKNTKRWQIQNTLNDCTFMLFLYEIRVFYHNWLILQKITDYHVPINLQFLILFILQIWSGFHGWSHCGFLNSYTVIHNS